MLESKFFCFGRHIRGSPRRRGANGIQQLRAVYDLSTVALIYEAAEGGEIQGGAEDTLVQSATALSAKSTLPYTSRPVDCLFMLRVGILGT